MRAQILIVESLEQLAKPLYANLLILWLTLQHWQQHRPRWHIGRSSGTAA